jgi:hypothetical protein
MGSVSASSLHDHAGVPRDVVVEAGGGVKPRLELHLLLADAVGVEVGVDSVRLPVSLPRNSKSISSWLSPTEDAWIWLGNVSKVLKI